jgi:hypothetical protein
MTDNEDYVNKTKGKLLMIEDEDIAEAGEQALHMAEMLKIRNVPAHVAYASALVLCAALAKGLRVSKAEALADIVGIVENVFQDPDSPGLSI